MAAAEREAAPGSPPDRPDPDDCCGGGCAPCVWDTYYDQLEAYEARLAAAQAAAAAAGPAAAAGDGRPSAAAERLPAQAQAQGLTPR
eukprot:SM000048S16503  [mRNA]  locus=s48:86950:87210:- [translate_table: standard]